MALVLKTGMGAISSWVRIPLPPPLHTLTPTLSRQGRGGNSGACACWPAGPTGRLVSEHSLEGPRVPGQAHPCRRRGASPARRSRRHLPTKLAPLPRSLGGGAVVKAQVHAGGRGKAGGIKVVSSPAEAAEAAGAMLGTRLVTFQTGPEGVPVDAVLVEEPLDIERELYVGIVTDGAVRGPVVMVSEAGGMDIEEVAETTPDKIIRVACRPRSRSPALPGAQDRVWTRYGRQHR